LEFLAGGADEFFLGDEFVIECFECAFCAGDFGFKTPLHIGLGDGVCDSGGLFLVFVLGRDFDEVSASEWACGDILFHRKEGLLSLVFANAKGDSSLGQCFL